MEATDFMKVYLGVETPDWVEPCFVARTSTITTKHKTMLGHQHELLSAVFYRLFSAPDAHVMVMTHTMDLATRLCQEFHHMLKVCNMDDEVEIHTRNYIQFRCGFRVTFTFVPRLESIRAMSLDTCILDDVEVEELLSTEILYQAHHVIHVVDGYEGKDRYEYYSDGC